MSDSLIILMLILGTYRTAHMVVYEDGPFELFTELRSVVNNRFGERHWVTKGMNCTLCTSFWLSAVVGLIGVLLLSLSWLMGIVLWFGIAGGCLVVDSIVAAFYRIGGRK